MIVFKTDIWSWDLTHYKLTFKEESPFFAEKITKNYSFPITVELNEDTAYKLGLVHLEGITDYKNKIYGTLIIDNEFFESYIAINSIVGKTAEITFFYGKETLAVFDRQLADLPFLLQTTNGFNLAAHAKDLLDSSWPDVSHQFISVWREDVASKKNFNAFDGWINQMEYNDALQTWLFVINEEDTIDGETVAVNRNVMAPMPYLLEILKVAFKTEGLELRGEIVDSDFFKKLLLVPKNFMEKYAVTEYLNYSFSTYSFQESYFPAPLNVYQQVHTPQNQGAYSLKMQIDLNSALAQVFILEVTQNGETIYNVETQNQQVSINETLQITVDATTVLEDIIVTLKLIQQPNSIAQYNNFTFEYTETQLNIFPEIYSLKDFMPDLSFRKFFNRIKTWANLDVIYTENAVYLNFLENTLQKFLFKDRSHLEEPRPERTFNSNNLFKLSYPDGDQIMVNKDGQTFDDSDVVSDEITEVDFELQPLKVEENFGKLTATYPEDDEDIMLLIYDGTTNGQNLAKNHINNRTMSLQDVYKWQHEKWLQFRANSETVKDTFLMHYTEAINLREGEYKYNTKRLIVAIKKQRITNEWYEVELTAETF
jgi:hypothetical protein